MDRYFIEHFDSYRSILLDISVLGERIIAPWRMTLKEFKSNSIRLDRIPQPLPYILPSEQAHLDLPSLLYKGVASTLFLQLLN